eukprot:765163-Hanusia_phi.AAC.1
MEFYGSENVVCLCGAPKCRGTLGKPKEEERLGAGRGRLLLGKVLGKRGKSPSGRGGREGEEGADKKPREDPYSKIYPPAQRRRADESSKRRDVEERQVQQDMKPSQPPKQLKKAKEKKSEGSEASDSFIDSLTPKERRKQLALLRAFEKAKAAKSGGD